MLRPDVIIEKIDQAKFIQNTLMGTLIDTPEVKILVYHINKQVLKI